MIEVYRVTSDMATTLKTVVNNVFPMLAPQGTTLPFITYERTGFVPEGSKDGEYGMNIHYNINIITTDYTSGLMYLDSVRDALNNITSEYYEYEVEVNGSSEEAFDDGYVQHLSITIKA